MNNDVDSFRDIGITADRAVMQEHYGSTGKCLKKLHIIGALLPNKLKSLRHLILHITFQSFLFSLQFIS